MKAVKDVKVCQKEIGRNGEGCTPVITSVRIKAGARFNVLYFPDCAVSF